MYTQATDNQEQIFGGHVLEICLCIIIIYHVLLVLGTPICGCSGLHKRLQRLHHDGHVRPEIGLVLHTQRRHGRHLKHRN